MNAQVGRALWAVLHAYAKSYSMQPDDDDRQNALFFLKVFGAIVKENQGSCKCEHEWQKLLSDVPPPLGSKEEFFLWTIAAHDRVNRKRGHALAFPELTLRHPLLQ